jgi:hypothetical protein
MNLPNILVILINILVMNLPNILVNFRFFDLLVPS